VSYSLRARISNFGFIFPALIIFSVFYIIPFLFTLWAAFYSGDFISTSKWAGLKNFLEIFLYDKQWWRSLLNAGYITLWALTLQNFLAFLLALGVDKSIRAQNVYRMLFFLLPILSEIIFGSFGKLLFSSTPGVLNSILRSVGLEDFAREWLSSPKIALNCCAFLHCWKGFGWAFIILLAGLQTIPQELYEAARVDGANCFQIFFKITLPLMTPVIILVIILTILGSMQGFALIWAFTSGGPAGTTEVPVMRIYTQLTDSHRGGYACALGIVLGVILVIFSFSFLKISKRLKKA
jgi:ABC-type sugar transport system permease subunit